MSFASSTSIDSFDIAKQHVVQWMRNIPLDQFRFVCSEDSWFALVWKIENDLQCKQNRLWLQIMALPDGQAVVPQAVNQVLSEMESMQAC